MAETPTTENWATIACGNGFRTLRRTAIITNGPYELAFGLVNEKL
jgi:hypothetical protein